MRTTNKLLIAFCGMVFGICSVSSAALSDVEYFDFTGWDDTMIQGGGQTFNDIFGDIDVTVTTVGSFTSTFGTGKTFTTHFDDPGQSSLKFAFSAPLRLVIATKTVDGNETHSIFTSASESYVHDTGAVPVVAFPAGGISITGTAFGISPTGASFGETITSAPSTLLTLTYAALSNTPPDLEKYGQWMVGALVPEPNSVSLIGIGGLVMLLQLRKRRS